MNRMLNWFRLRKLENDLDRELKYHIDRRVSDLIQSGLPEPEARRRAAFELDGATQVREEVRDVWLTRWLRDFAYDLRFSVRSFFQKPVVHRDGSDFAGAGNWSDYRHLLTCGSSGPARAAGPTAGTAGSGRFERHLDRRWVWQL